MRPGLQSELFVACQEGLEACLRRELVSVGMPAPTAARGDLSTSRRDTNLRSLSRATALAGGVIVRGTCEDVYRLNLHLRTATRVLLRLGRFQPSKRSSLELLCRQIQWSSFFHSNDDVRIRCASDINNDRKSHD